MATDFVYLASASPRRRELLGQIGVDFAVRTADVDETPLPAEAPHDYVARVAEAKADRVWDAVAAQGRLVVAADTTVAVDGELFGKPADEREALAMLEVLSNRSHVVLSAVAARLGERRECLVNHSEVRFRATTDAERRAYCRTGEPFGKAGGYAIQGYAAAFVEHLNGSYSSVMGLPLFETAALLRSYGLPAWLASSDAGAANA